jgi:hypothetical protein
MPGFNLEEELPMVPRVSSDQLELVREVGCGAFGTVYEGYVHRLWGQHSPKSKVAIKVRHIKDHLSEIIYRKTFSSPFVREQNDRKGNMTVGAK